MYNLTQQVLADEDQQIISFKNKNDKHHSTFNLAQVSSPQEIKETPLSSINEQSSEINPKEIETFQSPFIFQTTSQSDEISLVEAAKQSELEILARKAEENGGIGYSYTYSNDQVIYCNAINTLTKSYIKEELTLCQLCNATKGIRIKESKNWYKELELTTNENITFNKIYQALIQQFQNTHIAFTLNGNYMCFVTSKFQSGGSYSLKDITSTIQVGKEIDIENVLKIDSDKIYPQFLAIRYKLDEQQRGIAETQFILTSKTYLKVQYAISDYFNYTLTSLKIDTFINSILFQGFLNTTYKGLSMPYSLTLALNDQGVIRQDKLYLIIEPYLNTMGVNTFTNIFNVPDSKLSQLMMPKGISSILNLPADLVKLEYSNVTSCFLGDTPISIAIQFRSPNYIFMPKIWFQNVSGTLQFNNFVNEVEINVYLTGYSYMDGQLIQANIEKQFKDSFYSVFMKAREGHISIEFIEEEIFSTFNVYTQDFWPEEDQLAMNIINYQLNLTKKSITLPAIKVYWIPRLMQVYSGYISIYSQHDAYIYLLMSNLAGTTLQNTHLVFQNENAQTAFKKVFNLNEQYSYYSELRVFEMKQFELSFTNQDIALNGWPNLKQVNVFADENIWVEGVSVKITLKLIQENSGDIFMQSYSHIFKQLVGDLANEELILSGTFINQKQGKLICKLPDLQISKQMKLTEANFVVLIDIEDLQSSDYSNSRNKGSSSQTSSDDDDNDDDNDDDSTNLNSPLKIDTYIEGIVQLSIDGTNQNILSFTTKIDADSLNWISVEGTLNGVYSQLLNLRNSYLSQITLHGQLDYTGNIRNISLHGMGLFGENCFQISNNYRKNKQIENMIEMISQHNTNDNQEFTLSFTDQIEQILFQKLIGQRDLLNISNPKQCFTGDVKYGLNLTDYSYSYIKGHLWVPNLESLLYYILKSNTFLNNKQLQSLQSAIIYPLLSLEFENGIDFTYSPLRAMHYRATKIVKGFRFDGNVRFLGIKCFALIDYSISKKWQRRNHELYDLKVKLVIPSFTIGSENIQLISLNDFYITLTEEETKRVTLNPITLTTTIFPESIDSLQVDISQLQIKANIKVLGYITQTILILDENKLTFTIDDAFPFKGIFNAFITGFVVLNSQKTQSIRDYDCILNATLKSGTSQYKELEEKINKEIFDNWIQVGVRTIYQYYERATEIMQYLNILKKEAELCDINSCLSSYQCIDAPTIQCTDYRKEFVCKEQIKMCQNIEGYKMKCEQIKENVQIGTFNGEPIKTKICQAWSYQCNDDDNSNSEFSKSLLNIDKQNNICGSYEYIQSYTYCSNFKLDCVKKQIHDEYCMLKCINKQEEFAMLERRQKNFVALSEAASELFSSLQILQQAYNNSEKIISIPYIGINADLSSETYNPPDDYNLTLSYFLRNLGSDMIRSINILGKDFNYYYTDLASKSVSHYIRQDICMLYNMSWSFADNLDIAIEKLYFLVQTVTFNETSKILTKKEIIDYVIKETEDYADYVKELNSIKSKVQRISSKISQVPLQKAPLVVTNLLDIIMPNKLPSGLDTINYDLNIKNPID